MIKSSGLMTKATISSVLGKDYTEPDSDDEKQLRDGGICHDAPKMYEESTSHESVSDEESSNVKIPKIISPLGGKIIRKKELPTPLFVGEKYYCSFVKKTSFCILLFFIVFADARQKTEEPIGRYFIESNIFKAWSLVALPITLPIDLFYATTKR